MNLLPINSFGQEPSFQFFTGFTGYNMHNKSMKTSLESYADYWKSHGESPVIKGEKFAREYNFGFFYTGKKGRVFGYSYSDLTYEPTIQLSVGTRHFLTKYRGSTLYIGHKYPNNVCVRFGVGTRTTSIRSGYEYLNGTLSYGSDKSLNGIYACPVNSWVFSLEASKQFNFFKVFALEIGASVARFGGSMSYRDPSYARTMNQSVNYESIPTDYNQFFKATNTDDVYLDDGKSYVKPKCFTIAVFARLFYTLKFSK